MKIVFTTFPVEISTDRNFVSMRSTPSTAMYLLSSVLIGVGYDVTILDPYIIANELKVKSLDDIIKHHLNNCSVVCISSNTINWPSTVIAIKSIRKALGNEIQIVLGGLHPTYFYEHIIKNHDIDYIIRGEGELTLPMLIKSINTGVGFEKIPGLVKKRGALLFEDEIPRINNEVFKNLPLPAFEYLPNQAYLMLPVETSRGCQFSCAFCSIQDRNNWRDFDTSFVLSRNQEIIDNFLNKFKAKNVFITDDCLTANFSRASIILKDMVKRNDDIGIIIESRVTDWIVNECDKYLDAFLVNNIRLNFGVECGYDEGLKRISKGLTIDKLESVLHYLDDCSLINQSCFSFIIGFPWENIEDCLKTIRYAAHLVKKFGNGIVNLNWLQIYPSKIWDERLKYNIHKDESVYDEEIIISAKYFYDFHPTISRSSREYLNHVINEYESKGICLRGP
ncbi:MAG: B12-binding domain-containing radical SAM protein [Oscillospiraceae bacterium]|nr:B12-binding domain-containing radical SAM protein [Oscillospiraceae bacterium]